MALREGEGEEVEGREGERGGEGGKRRERVRQGHHVTSFLTSYHSPVQNIL